MSATDPCRIAMARETLLELAAEQNDLTPEERQVLEASAMTLRSVVYPRVEKQVAGIVELTLNVTTEVWEVTA